LTLQNNETVFEAKFETGIRSQLKEFASGSRVALTGVYRLHYNEHQIPEYFLLSLRSPSDVEILQRPSGGLRNERFLH
jgi:hypothetical protein